MSQKEKDMDDHCNLGFENGAMILWHKESGMEKNRIMRGTNKKQSSTKAKTKMVKKVTSKVTKEKKHERYYSANSNFAYIRSEAREKDTKRYKKIQKDTERYKKIQTNYDV
jgi:hypothetical protein